MFKTPVSILQEAMMKEQIVPNYNLIHNEGGGTHANVFTYKVICGNYVATGTGRSKKDAKHNAAEAMLRTIAEHRNYPQLPESTAQSPVRTPIPPTVETPKISPNEPFINFVGKLQDLCAENNLQNPEYVQISDVGPPHAKIFTIQCKVSVFKEIGTAKTKKQAKQYAAKKLVDKLTNLVSERVIENSNDTILKSQKVIQQETIDVAKSRYVAMKKATAIRKVNLGVKLCKIHEELKNFLGKEASERIKDELNSFRTKLNDKNISQTTSSLQLQLQDIMSNYDLCLTTTILDTTDPLIHCVCMYINSSPDFAQIGYGDTVLDAHVDATIKLVTNLLFMLE